jgi:flagellar hook-associated protein 3 FlgL
MAIRTSGIISGFNGADFVRMKNQLAELQRQLGSGKKAETYGGLGADRGFALGFRSSISQIEAWQQNISLVSTRINLIDQSLDGVQDAVSSTKTSLQATSDFALASGRTIGQIAAGNSLDAVVSMLNASDGGRFLFGGRKTGTPPVLDSGRFMAGEGTKDGFKTVMLQRMQADLGSSAATPERDATATGRLTMSAVGADPVTLTEDGAHPFGLKIAAVSGAVGGLTATHTAGPPASLSIASGAGNASVGENLTVEFTLPDGSTERLTLTAAAADAETLGTTEFRVGATSAETLANLRTTLGTQMAELVHGKLAAASAVKAGDDFFHGETNPAALAGPPVVEAGVPKRLVAGVSGTMADAVAYDTPQNADTRTVRWYQGDRTSSDPRATSSAEVDAAVSVSYGVRADEEALRTTVQNLAVASTLTFSSDDPHALVRYQALSPRVVAGLSMENSTQTVEAIRIEIAAANSGADSAKVRHTDAKSMLGGLLTDIEGVDDNEIAVQILALQTNLQASYQTSSMLSKLTLVSYL